MNHTRQFHPQGSLVTFVYARGSDTDDAGYKKISNIPLLGS
jgi:hypothetical protein